MASSKTQTDSDYRQRLREGIAIPAQPLALNASRKLDERRQRALSRYYLAAGCGGVAVGVHTTQFAIRDPKIGLFEPVLTLAREEFDRHDATAEKKAVRIAGVCGDTDQALAEAELAKSLGYHAGLLSLAALKSASNDEMIEHCRRVSEVFPVVGFYLQPSVGGRALPFEFWRGMAELPGVVAIKIAPFNRYQTLDVVRAVAEAGRDDLTLYTGNDDNIVLDLVAPYPIRVGGKTVQRRIAGGLLGHWSVWAKKAVEILEQCKTESASGEGASEDLLRLAIEVTDTNAAFFDAANGFAGCIAGLHEVLRRQGLLEGIWCLDPDETFGPGQLAEIDRIYEAYPHLNDDAFVAEHRDEWLSG